MKRVVTIFAAAIILAGCQTPNTTLVYDCNIDQSINQISRDRNGTFTFATAAPKARVYFFNDVINIRDFEFGEYAGFQLEKSTQQRQIESIKDFKVVLNKGDYYHDDGHIIEIVSPKQKTISLFLVSRETGKTDSLQLLNECEKKYVVVKTRPHDHVHDNRKEHPLLKVRN